MKKMFAALMLAFGIAPCVFAQAGVNYLGGVMTNVTMTPQGLLVMLSSGPPSNCNGTPYGWMLIPESNKTMVATALLMWFTQADKSVTVYTDPYAGSGFCRIGQWDPN